MVKKKELLAKADNMRAKNTFDELEKSIKKKIDSKKKKDKEHLEQLK